MREIHRVINEYLVLKSRWKSLNSWKLGEYARERASADRAGAGPGAAAPDSSVMWHLGGKPAWASAHFQGGTNSDSVTDGKESQRKIKQRRILLMLRNLNTCELRSAWLPWCRELNG